MPEDLRARYESLLVMRNARKAAHDEQKTRVRVLEDRAKEILTEARVYGANSIKELDDLIKAEEGLILQQLGELEAALQKSIPVDSPPKQTTTSTVTVDEILRTGGQ